MRLKAARVASISHQVGQGKAGPVGEVAFQHYRPLSLIGQSKMSKVSAAHGIVIGRDADSAECRAHPRANNPRQETSKMSASALS